MLQKCLQNPDELYQPDMLLDPMLTPRQAQRYVVNRIKKNAKVLAANGILHLNPCAVLQLYSCYVHISFNFFSVT